MSTTKTRITLVSIVLLSATALLATTATAALNPLKTREAAIKHVAKLAGKTAKIRHKCANDIENGLLPWTIDCSEDPVAFGGAGTGDLKLNGKLEKTLGRSSKRYRTLRDLGTPSETGLNNACAVATEDWDEVYDCLFDEGNDASKQLLDLSFNPTQRTVEQTERTCRLVLGRVTRSFYTKTLRNRAKCFSKNGLLGFGDFADQYECLAPAIPPGLGAPLTGLTSTDTKIRKSFNLVRSQIRNACPDYMEANGFPGNLADATAGTFYQSDAVGVVLETIINELQPVLTGIYAGEEYCGDGIIQAELGEECDDGDRDSCETDSTCDRNCTLQGCGNGVACEDTVTPANSEECDDGDSETGDGCNELCEAEYCGDGVQQTALGEECDDANQLDGDGCSSECLSGF
jgi:cysteine-rich repeat protein